MKSFSRYFNYLFKTVQALDVGFLICVLDATLKLSFQALDVGFLLRKAATISTPMMDVSEQGGTWNLKTSTTLKTMELKFKVQCQESMLNILFLTNQLGEEFDETTPDGRQTKALVTFDDGKIVTVQTAKKEGQKSTKVKTFILLMSCIFFTFSLSER